MKKFGILTTYLQRDWDTLDDQTKNHFRTACLRIFKDSFKTRGYKAETEPTIAEWDNGKMDNTGDAFHEIRITQLGEKNCGR